MSPKSSSFPTEFRGFQEHGKREQPIIAPEQLLLGCQGLAGQVLAGLKQVKVF